MVNVSVPSRAAPWASATVVTPVMPLVVTVYWPRLPVKDAMSVPAPPSRVSLPPCPVRVSLPTPPESVSTPAPPNRRSLPEPPVRTSAKFDPWTELTPPRMLSTPIPAPSDAAMLWAFPEDKSTETPDAAWV
ncbi:hypothetical protein ACVWWG_005249 [Bradyrhizobium sp. LB7.2]